MTQLWPHQQDNLAFFLGARRKDGGLASGNLGEARTGKTRPAILLAEQSGALDQGYVLVLTRKTVVLELADQFQSILPHRRVVTLTGSSARKKAQFAHVQRGEVVITNHDSAIHLAQWFIPCPPSMLIWDEAHTGKNPKAKLTRAIKLIPARHRHLLTATPKDWKDHDLWSLLNWLDPGAYPNYWRWVGKYEWWLGGTYIGPKKEMRAELKAELARYFRFDARDVVLPYLPQGKPQLVRLPWDEQQWNTYNSVTQFNVANEWDDVNEEWLPGRVEIASETAKYVRQLQICDDPAILKLRGGSPKYEYILERLRRDGGPVGIYSRFSKQAFSTLQPLLVEAGYKVVRITGKESQKQRKEAEDAINSGRADVVLCAYGAGGEGINLFVHTQVMLDMPWPYFHWEQALSRAKGDGNPYRRIDILALCMVNSYEEYVWRLLDRKESVSTAKLMRSAA